jgi:hypothetical protein
MRMLRILAACLLVLSPIAAGAQPALPQVAPGTPYSAARAALLAQGWQPLRDPEADRCAEGDPRCAGRPEMVACAGTGLGQCLFAWRRGDIAIEVITAGRDTAVTGLRQRR